MSSAELGLALETWLSLHTPSKSGRSKLVQRPAQPKRSSSSIVVSRERS